MVRVLFICLGNICRSPMAEFLFKDMVKKKGKEQFFHIESKATCSAEVGNSVHYGTRKLLDKLGISYAGKVAEQMSSSDYENFDYIIYMEDRNLRDIHRFIPEDPLCKMHKITDFTNNPRDVADPYYTGNFDITYNDIIDGLNDFYDFLIKNGEIK